MAHSNIDQRREHVQKLLNEGVKIDYRMMVAIAKTFHCSHSAIRADVIELSRDPELPTPYVSNNMREMIHMRDAKVCQYCGNADPRDDYIVEHVIPAAMGGVARSYNLVIACQRCNIRKGQNVWVPHNLDLITQDYPEWKLRILELADPDQPVYFVEQVCHPQVIEEYRKSLKALKEQAKQNRARRRILNLVKQANQIVCEYPSIGSEKWHKNFSRLVNLVQQIDS